LGQAELDEAAKGGPLAQMHTGQAAGHAKRALDALFDCFIERDYLGVRLPARAQFSAKLNLLRHRIPSLSWRLIPVVVARHRDVFEHERKAPSLDEAGMAVEAACTIVAAISRSASLTLDAHCGPAFAGHMIGSLSSSKGRYHVAFGGLPPVFAWIWRCRDGLVRAGVGKSSSPLKAKLIFSEVGMFSFEEHLEMLRWWDGLCTSGRHGESELFVRAKFMLAGLDGPPGK
jgi:hypothetical protein